jgi:molybdenum cofactor cytidylyltransferase
VTVAIVPAGGRSSRMGRPKLTLPVGGRPVIERVVDGLLAGGVARVLVVVGPHGPEVGRLAAAAGADVLPLAEPTADMRATVERGLAWVEEHLRPGPEDWWLLQPADQPLLAAGAVCELLSIAGREVASTVLVPVHANKRGHPLLMRWRHAAGIRGLPAGEGINSYVKRLAGETREIEVSDSRILADLDTPEDYQRLVEAESSSTRRGAG